MPVFLASQTWAAHGRAKPTLSSERRQTINQKHPEVLPPLDLPNDRTPKGHRAELDSVANRPGSSSRPSSQVPQCLHPTTRILTEDLEWIPVGELSEGDELWAFDEMPRGQARRTTITTVESTSWARKPAFSVTTKSGRTIVADKEHRFLSYSGGGTLSWRKLETLFRPYGNGKKAALAHWMLPWEPKTHFDEGWLSGMFDGEGSLSKRKRDGSSLVLVISQNTGPVLEQVKLLLTADGYHFNCYPAAGKTSTHNLGLRGGTREFMRFLGSYRPRRLLNKLTISDCDLELWLTPDPIIDITALGMKDLISISTGEGTYFAEGFAVCDSSSRVKTHGSRT